MNNPSFEGLGDLGKGGARQRWDESAGLLECITEFNNSSSHSTSRALVLGRWAEIHADRRRLLLLLQDTRYMLRYVPRYPGTVRCYYLTVWTPKTLQEKENGCVTRGRVDGWMEGRTADGPPTSEHQHQHQHQRCSPSSSRVSEWVSG